MSTNDTPQRHPEGPASAISGRLRELRRLVRSSLALRAASLLVAATCGLVLVSLLVDRLFRLPLGGRVAAQSVYALVLGWLVWKLFLRPATRRLPDRILADLIERRFPQLHDKFRSALEFSREPNLFGPGASDEIQAVLKRQVVASANEEARALRPDEVVDTPRVVSSLSSGVAAAALLAVIGALWSGSFTLWFRRNVLFDSVDWPYRTQLVLEGFEAPALTRGVPRGDALHLRVEARGEIPNRVRLRLRYARETQAANLAKEGEALFVHELAEVTEPFTFTVDGGDYRTPPHTVLVLERPEVKETRVTLEYPAYTQKATETFTGDVGDLSVPEGTRLQIDGLASKALRKAWLDAEGTSLELTVGPEGTPAAFHGAWTPGVGGVATIRLEDQEDVPPNQFFRFVVTPVPDRVPTVLASTEGIGSMITPMARIPLQARAADDYGVTALGVEYTITQTSAATEAAPQAVKGSDPFPALTHPGPQVETGHAWEIGPLQIEPDHRLDIRVWAQDNDGLHGAKTGVASTQSFLVVTPQRLGEELLRREEEQRRVLERVAADERMVRDMTYRLIDQAWKAEGALDEAVVKEMAGMARTERQLARQVTGIAGAMRLLRDEMLNNRLGEGEEIERLVSAIIEPLTDIAERLLPEAATRIAAIREQEKPTERMQQGLALANDLETILARIESVLAHMRRLEGFTEIVNRLRAVLKVHDEATSEAKKIYEKEIQSIFDPVDPVDPGKNPAAGGNGQGKGSK